MVDEIKTTYMHKNPLIRNFFRLKAWIALRMACLKKSDLILDFGCGGGWLKNELKNAGYNVVGYDITPEHSDVKDYKKLKPDKIFVLDVFEHIPKEEIKLIIENFKKMNPNFVLVTIIPTEGWISRKIRRLLGKNEKTVGHITSLKEILQILNSELKQEKKINFLCVSYIGKFKVRD